MLVLLLAVLFIGIEGATNLPGVGIFPALALEIIQSTAFGLFHGTNIIVFDPLPAAYEFQYGALAEPFMIVLTGDYDGMVNGTADLAMDDTIVVATSASVVASLSDAGISANLLTASATSYTTTAGSSIDVKAVDVGVLLSFPGGHHVYVSGDEDVTVASLNANTPGIPIHYAFVTAHANSTADVADALTTTTTEVLHVFPYGDSDAAALAAATSAVQVHALDWFPSLEGPPINYDSFDYEYDPPAQTEKEEPPYSTTRSLVIGLGVGGFVVVFVSFYVFIMKQAADASKSLPDA